jgi:hypothetical protein
MEQASLLCFLEESLTKYYRACRENRNVCMADETIYNGGIKRRKSLPSANINLEASLLVYFVAKY